MKIDTLGEQNTDRADTVNDMTTITSTCEQGLWSGARYLAAAAGLVARTPGLLRLCLLPFVITAVLYVGVCVLTVAYWGDLMGMIWQRPGNAVLLVLWYLAYALGLLTAFVVVLMVFFALQALIAAPFNDMLSERVERAVGTCSRSPSGTGAFLTGLTLTIAHEVRKLALWLSVMLMLFVLNLLLPIVGTAVFSIGGFYVTARFLSYDAMDYAMGRRLWSFKRKRLFLRQHRAPALGLGLSLATTMLVPPLGLICMPLAAVAGTMLFCDLERGDA